MEGVMEGCGDVMFTAASIMYKDYDFLHFLKDVDLLECMT